MDIKMAYSTRRMLSRILLAQRRVTKMCASLRRSDVVQAVRNASVEDAEEIMLQEAVLVDMVDVLLKFLNGIGDLVACELDQKCIGTPICPGNSVPSPEKFLKEAATFPRRKHDDYVDAVASLRGQRRSPKKTTEFPRGGHGDLVN